MARVRAFRIAGVEMRILSGDHSPPHFHARRLGHWHVRVFFLEEEDSMVELLGPRNARISGSDRRAILRGVAGNRAALLAEWEACQDG